MNAFLQLSRGKRDGLRLLSGNAHSRNVLVDPSEIENVKQSPDFYSSQTPYRVASDGALVFRTDHKWYDVIAGETGDSISKYMQTMGFPKGPIFAFVLITTAPTADILAKASEVVDIIVNTYRKAP